MNKGKSLSVGKQPASVSKSKGGQSVSKPPKATGKGK